MSTVDRISQERIYVNNRTYEISYILKIAHNSYTKHGEVFSMISYEPLFKTMKERGITSYRLGKMGFPLSNYYAIKRGENVSTHTVDQLCKLLQCRIEEVLEYIDKE